MSSQNTDDVYDPAKGRPEEASGSKIVMTVADAQRIFSQYTNDFLEEQEHFVDLLRKNHIEQAISNSNYLHALTLTDLMFRHTDRSFRMLTGFEGDGFLKCLCKSFKSMLTRIQERGGKARIILVDGDATDLQSIREEFKDTLEVVEAVPSNSESSIAHFLVCDTDMVRDEKPHKKLAEGGNANQIHAEVYFANRFKGGTFSRKFDLIWEKLVPAE